MRRFLTVIACCAVLQPALAAGPASAPPAPVLLQTALAAPAGPAAPDAPVVVASLKDVGPTEVSRGEAPAEDERPPTGKALLVAGLAIMTGIALRRRGSDQP